LRERRRKGSLFTWKRQKTAFLRLWAKGGFPGLCGSAMQLDASGPR